MVTAIFIFSLFLNNYSSVYADSGPGGVTVTPLSGETNFKITSVDLSRFAGAYATDNGDYQPTGFAKNEAKFASGAFSISGITYGTQTTCVQFANYAYGWRGSLYQWIGARWQKMPTTFVEGEDGSPAKACATTYGNGTYALIVYYDQAAAPKAKSGECVEDISWYSWDWGAEGIFNAAFRFTGDYVPEVGTHFKWKISSVSPVDFLTPTSGSGTIELLDGVTVAPISGLSFPAEMYGHTNIAFTIEIQVGGCHIDNFFGSGNFN